MSTLDILMAAAGSAASTPLVVSDVFATALYTGNSSTQTINNGIDLAGKGGMVWCKGRSSAESNVLYDTARGPLKRIQSNSINGENTNSDTLTSFNADGFSLGADTTTGNINYSAKTYASWTFRKAPKFFDVVTYTGTGVNQNIPHNLGVKPGLVIIKCTSAPGNWAVGARVSDSQWVSSRATDGFCLNLTAATTAPYYSNNTSATTFNTAEAGAGYESTTTNGATYVAYLFAHDSSADGVIQCGSFTTDASGTASINLGYRPQFVLFKLTSTSGDWVITDSARGMPTGTGDKVLLANSTAAETTKSIIDTSSTGFSLTGLSANSTGIYMAIKSAV